MSKILITSALPYVNGVKHLGNLAGSLLPADIHARFHRQIGNETLFLCGTDEHGTPAELAAAAAGLDVATYCARQHAIQADIYRRFAISFDHFSRSSGAANHALTQELYRRLDAAGFIAERTIRQPYSATDGRFLQDRLVEGTCPHCGDKRARGDQCDACGRLLEPVDLIAPRSALSGATDIELRETRHLFLKLGPFADRLRTWIEQHADWPPLVRGIALGWLDEGLRDRCITRDLAWGVPVPRRGFENKVFYVWFDAPIGYIAATVEWAAQAPGRDWRDWWEGGDAVRYAQFLAKDNVAFHAVFFPATLLGSGLPLKLPDLIKGFSWLSFAGRRFSTNRGHGIFTDAALEELPADAWRWWLAANAPESADTDLSLARLAGDVNKDLADVLGNLVNRCLAFTTARFNGVVPEGDGEAGEAALAAELDTRLAALRQAHESAQLRKAAAEARAIWSLANGYLAAQAPWSAIRTNRARAAAATRIAVNLVRLAAVVAWPFIPTSAERVLAALGETASVPPFPADARAALRAIPAGRAVTPPPLLFAKIDAETVARLEAKYGSGP
jgi:methionyl-tRNA synthetase